MVELETWKPLHYFFFNLTFTFTECLSWLSSVLSVCMSVSSLGSSYVTFQSLLPHIVIIYFLLPKYSILLYLSAMKITFEWEENKGAQVSGKYSVYLFIFAKEVYFDDFALRNIHLHTTSHMTKYFDLYLYT